MKSVFRAALLFWLLLPSVPAWAKGRSSQLLVGSHVQIAPGETRDQDLVCLACHVVVDGALDGDLVLVGGRLDVNGSVTGDVVVLAGPTTLGEHASLGGDLANIGGRLARAPGALVAGNVSASGPGGLPVGVGMGLLLGLGFGLLVPAMVCGLLAALLAYAVMGERRVGAIAGAIHQHAGLAVLAGAAGCIAWIFLSHSPRLLRPVTAPVHIALALLLLLALVAGYTGLSFAVGRRVAGRSSPLGFTMIGALVIAAIQVIPVLGWLAILFFAWLALGGCILSGFGAAPNWFERRRRAV
ncbi:MAG: hypothetical protein JO041_11630 [Acidobacteria bacterium]|nr:hypothetical protein [Acidobacteriota bacterium]